MPSLYDNSNEGVRRSYPLERAWVRNKLIRELAEEKVTQVELAERYGVTPVSIGNFKKRHWTEITDVRDDLDNQFAGLWIAKKEARLAEYQDDVDRIGETLNHELLKAKQIALRSAAEEMGQLPSRFSMQVNTAPVTYKINGVDLEKLR